MNFIKNQLCFCSSLCFRQRRHWIPTGSSSINGDSGNVSQEEHDEDQERYFEKIQRIKRTELEVNISF